MGVRVSACDTKLVNEEEAVLAGKNQKIPEYSLERYPG
jgi:hypothetical protein